MAFTCPEGLAWDTNANTCNWPSAVEGCQNPNGPRSGSDKKANQRAGGSESEQAKPKCEKPGFFRSPQSCNKFYRCTDDLRLFNFDCPGGLVFNEELSICDWPSDENSC